MERATAISEVIKAVGTRKTTAHGYTNPYGAQCLAFIAWYTAILGYKSIMPGYDAIDVYNKNPLGLQKIAPRDAQPGDIHFMRFLDYGHTGVVVEVTSDGVHSVDQNWFGANLNVGSPAARVFHPFGELIGLLRPNFGGGNKLENIITESHRNLIRVVSSEVKGWDRTATHRGDYDEKEMRHWKGKKISDYSQGAWDEGAQYRKAKDAWKAAFDKLPAVERRVKELEAQVASLKAGESDKKLQQIKDVLGVK